MSTTHPADQTGRAPAALRSRRPGWRNPRLVLGVLLVAGCVLAGARLLAAAEQTTAVWAVAETLPVGAEVRTEDLEPREVRFPDAATAAAYLAAREPVAAGSRLLHEVRAGELLPAAAVTSAEVEPRVEVPLAVAPEDLPATVRQGSLVDVWVGRESSAERVLESVEVVAVPSAEDGLAPTPTRQVILGVPEDVAGTALPQALGGSGEGRVVVTRVG